MGKELYVLYSRDYSGETAARVFDDEVKAHHAMLADMEEVIDILHKDGYTPDSAESDDDAEAFVADTDIYYEWEILESEME